jgi:hypothetical protein
MFAGSKKNIIVAAITAKAAAHAINAKAACPGYERGSWEAGFGMKKWIAKYIRIVSVRQKRLHGIVSKAPQFPSIDPERTMAEARKREEAITLSVKTGLHRNAAPIESPRQSMKAIICSMFA